MSKLSCPYCGEDIKPKNIIDEGHMRLTGMKKKGNTRKIYLCPECGEVFEGFQHIDNYSMPVDMFYNRKIRKINEGYYTDDQEDY